MSRESTKAIDRAKKIGAMSHDEQRWFLASEKDAKPKPEQLEHTIKCENCGKEWDLATLPEENLRYETTPNTLTNLRDMNNVAWHCPHCDFWHTKANETDEV